jgi:hypothetical protein
MRIALQISGRLRFTEDSIGSMLGSIIETLHPDVFCSFWNPENHETFETYAKITKPTLIEMEDQSLVRPYLDALFPPQVWPNMPSMSYKFNRVTKVRQMHEHQQGFRYDCVIQARTDNLFFEKLDLDRCQMSLDQDRVLCCNQAWTPTIDTYTTQPRMVDNFYLGPRVHMDLANDTFWYIRRKANELASQGKHHEMHTSEIIEDYVWKDLGVPIGSLTGSGRHGNFWYDIDRRETPWR